MNIVNTNKIYDDFKQWLIENQEIGYVESVYQEVIITHNDLFTILNNIINMK